MLIDVVLIITGLVLLYFGAGSVVNSASRMARRFGLSELWIGLTVVAFGTSSPELLVAITSNLTGYQDITLSNIAGANIANITLVLGMSGLVAPLTIEDKSTRRELFFLIVSSIVFVLLSFLGREITRIDGIILLALFTFFTFTCCYVDFYREPPICKKMAKELPKESNDEKKVSIGLDVFLIILGIGGLTLGAHFTVNSAVRIAEALNIPQTVIGATIIALGTTLPELFTSVYAAAKGQLDISIGNIIGSCIFNMLSIVGISAVMRPIVVNPSLLVFDFPVMILTSIIVIPMINPDFRIDRTKATILLLCYVFYVVTNLLR